MNGRADTDGPLHFIEARDLSRFVADDDPGVDDLVAVCAFHLSYAADGPRPFAPFVADLLRSVKPELRAQVVAYRQCCIADEDDPIFGGTCVITERIVFYRWPNGTA